MTKKAIATSIIAFQLLGLAWADFEWPSEAVTVRIENQVAPVVWRDGRPFAERSKVAAWLRIPKEGEFWVDLTAVCQEKKARVAQKEDGSIDVIVPTAASTSESRSPSSGVVSTQPPSKANYRYPILEASGYRYVADTQYIRAFCVIQNVGTLTSPACSARGEFVDWYGKAFAQDSREIPSLSPGERVEVEFFSMVREDEMTPGGVIKADKYTCRVSFPGLPTSPVGPTGSSSPTRAKYQPKAKTSKPVRTDTFKMTPGKTDGFTRNSPAKVNTSGGYPGE